MENNQPYKARIKVMFRWLHGPDHKTLRHNWSLFGNFQPFVDWQKAHTQLNSSQFKFISKFLQLPDFRWIHINRLFNRLAFPAEFLLEVCSCGIIAEKGLVHGCEAVAQSTGAGTQGVLREFIKARSQAAWAKPKRKLHTVILLNYEKMPLSSHNQICNIFYVIYVKGYPGARVRISQETQSFSCLHIQKQNSNHFHNP